MICLLQYTPCFLFAFLAHITDSS